MTASTNPSKSLSFSILHLTFSIHVPYLSNDLRGDSITRSGGGDEAGEANGATNLYKQRLRRVVNRIFHLFGCYTNQAQPAAQDPLRWHTALRPVPVVSTSRGMQLLETGTESGTISQVSEILTHKLIPTFLTPSSG